LRGYPPALLLSGSIKAQVGQLAQAEELLARYVALVPGNRLARRLLAGVQLQADRARAAADTLAPLVADPATQGRRTLQLLSSVPLRAGDSRARGKPSAASRRWATSRGAAGARLPERPRAGGAAAGLARGGDAARDPVSTRRLRNARADAALRRAEELVAATPGSTEALNLLGAVHLARGEDDKARERFEAGARLDPDLESAQANLDGSTSALAGLAGVEERLRRRLEGMPRGRGRGAALGRVLARSDRVAEAETLLREKAAAAPRSVRLRVALAGLLRSRDDKAGLLSVADELRAVGEGRDGDPAALEAAGGIYLAERRLDRGGRQLPGARRGAAPERRGQDSRSPAASTSPATRRARAPRSLPSAIRRRATRSSTTASSTSSSSRRRARRRSRSRGALAPSTRPIGRAAGEGAAARQAAGRGGQDPRGGVPDGPSPALARALFSRAARAGEEEKAVAGLRGWLAARPDDAANLDLLSQTMIQKGDWHPRPPRSSRRSSSCPRTPPPSTTGVAAPRARPAGGGGARPARAPARAERPGDRGHAGLDPGPRGEA
jgi:tetratricopeptide (TPR) repeat protein